MKASDELSMLIHGEVGKIHLDEFVPSHEIFLLLCKIIEPKKARYIFWRYIQEVLRQIKDKLHVPPHILETFDSLALEDEKLILLASYAFSFGTIEPTEGATYLCMYKVMREEWSKIDESASNLCRSERPADHSADNGSA